MTHRTNTRRGRMALLAPLVAGLLLAACGSDDAESDATSASTTPAASTPAADTAPDATAGDKVSDGTTAVDTVATGDGTGNECTTGKTVDADTITFATGEPAFSPWVEDDDPASGKGFEAAVAAAVATELGYSADHVTWVRTTFDEAIAPGEKDYDLNLQQVSISPERAESVTFTEAYYSTNQAIVALAGSSAIGATSIADLKGVKFGAQAGTTSIQFINDVIQPDEEAYIYDDNVGAKAALDAGQIDAAVFDLPTALYVSAVEIEGSSVIGQFPRVDTVAGDDFGMTLSPENPLVDCVNTALTSLRDAGTLDDLATEWLSTKTDIPLIAL